MSSRGGLGSPHASQVFLCRQGRVSGLAHLPWGVGVFLHSSGSPRASLGTGGLLWHWNFFFWGIRPAGCSISASLCSLCTVEGEGGRKPSQRSSRGLGRGLECEQMSSSWDTGLRSWALGWHWRKGTSNGIKQSSNSA